jgi:hypothetical protein
MILMSNTTTTKTRAETLWVDMMVMDDLRQMNRDVVVDKSGLLYPVLLRAYGSRNRLVIPAYDNPLISDFIEKARKYAGDTSGKERVEAFTRYVQTSLRTGPQKTTLFEQDVPLENAILSAGVCRQKAALLQLILQSENIRSEFMAGTHEFITKGFLGGRLPNRKVSGAHAWIKVDEKKEYLSDPIYGKVGIYSKISIQTNEKYKNDLITLFFRRETGEIIMNPSVLRPGDALFHSLRYSDIKKAWKNELALRNPGH